MNGVSLQLLAAFLDRRLKTGRLGDVPTIWRPSGRAVRRLGLALDPEPVLEAAAGQCDALFLHRPFRLPMEALPGLGILAAHAAFDAHLTTGYNPALAAALGLAAIEPVADDGGGVIGMTGVLAEAVTWEHWEGRVGAAFGGCEASLRHRVRQVGRVAVMHAMRPALIERLAAAGVDTCLTGQLRRVGQERAAGLGLSVIAVGHRRAETWGLHQVARELAVAAPGLQTAVLPEPDPLLLDQVSTEAGHGLG